MKVLFLNTSERTGGAAIAANRLMQSMIKHGVEAKMLVRDRQTDDKNVVSINTSWWKKKINFLRFTYERWVIFVHNRFSRSNLFAVSIANTGTDISKHPLVLEADIIHLHWINQGFLSLKNIRQLIKNGKPVVWTMHDMWPCTGICHHAQGCEHYQNNCGNCPLLFSNKTNDLSYQILKKKHFFSKQNIQIVTVSSWLNNIAKKSIITKDLQITTIPNVFDKSVFFCQDKCKARNKLLFPQKKKIILMGAAKINESIKGFDFLRQALLILQKTRDDLLLVLFGEIKNDDSFLANIPIEYIHTGLLCDVSQVALLYAAADVTVVPSLYETFGQTISESMVCGCPVVSFNNSGQTDIIDHKQNGYLAEYKNVEDLAKGIEWTLFEANYEQLSQNARKKALDCYTEEVVAKKYMELYQNIITQKRNNSSRIYQRRRP